jgi:hypothetical protein
MTAPRKVVVPAGVNPKRWFYLTPAQQKVVRPFLKEIIREADKGAPGTLMAQVETPVDGSRYYVRFGFVTYHHAKAINHVLKAFNEMKAECAKRTK